MKRIMSAAAVVTSLVLLSACGDDGGNESSAAAEAPATTEVTELLDAASAAELLADAPEGLVVLDVRTPEEFAGGHIEGAVMVDFSAPTFVDEVLKLDPAVPYFVYCRSGNRSAQAVAAMQKLGFQQIYELDGGIGAWHAAGLPLVTT